MVEMLGVEDVSRAGNFEDDVYLKMPCVNLHLAVLPAKFFRTAPQISYFTIRYNHKLDLKSKEKITANHFLLINQVVTKQSERNYKFTLRIRLIIFAISDYNTE